VKNVWCGGCKYVALARVWQPPARAGGRQATNLTGPSLLVSFHTGSGRRQALGWRAGPAHHPHASGGRQPDAHASSAIQIRILSLAQKKKRDKNIISHHSIISKKILVANCINLSALSAALQSPNGSQKEKASETQNEIHATRTGNKFLVPLPPGILIVRQGEIRVDTFLLLGLGLCLLAATVLLTVLPPFLPSSSGCPPRNATQPKSVPQ
jgi:hypothetical protein